MTTPGKASAWAWPSNVLFASAASVWEIAIKRALPRNHLPFSANKAVGYFTQTGYTLLPIHARHAAAVEKLPAHHSDPFDRPLITQAQTEPLRLLAHDTILARYSDQVSLVQPWVQNSARAYLAPAK